MMFLMMNKLKFIITIELLSWHKMKMLGIVESMVALHCLVYQ